MHFALAEMPLPFRFRPETPMSDEELMRFCAANDFLRVERDANGEILVMTPAGNNTGRKNAYLIQVLGAWSDADGRGYAFDSNTGFTLPDGSMRSPDAAWIQAVRWDALSALDKELSRQFAPTSSLNSVRRQTTSPNSKPRWRSGSLMAPKRRGSSTRSVRLLRSTVLEMSLKYITTLLRFRGTES